MYPQEIDDGPGGRLPLCPVEVLTSDPRNEV